MAKDSAFFRRSQGGVTVGGGEPTFQADFVARFMKRCKSGGMHTAMETCGYCPWEGLEKIIEHTNMVFMDIKHMDDGEHRRLTGVSNETILENARNVAQKRPLVLRLPVVPGLNDAEENIRATLNSRRDWGTISSDLSCCLTMNWGWTTTSGWA